MEKLPSNININFNIGKYISGGIDLFRKDPGTIFGAFVLTLIFSIIPLFSLLAIGNFYKVCRDVDVQGKSDIGRIFNFDDFVPYLKFMFLLFLIVMIIVPFPLILFPLSLFSGEDGNVSNISLAFILGGFGVFILFYVIFLIVLSVATYYFIPLVALKGSHDIRKNISLSWQLAKKDFFSILIFIIISGFLSQLGILACGIGIFLTIPIVLCMRYKSFEKIMNL
ncbi:hypothetical protein [Epilithonimonas sp. UC225_85]|uniref:hypothetical protein n=1 Tax=Epilithonimonas sp. UC225_85 TaxID=3350167 RepID=UPI0036D303F4